jgi:hypothetical protein
MEAARGRLRTVQARRRLIGRRALAFGSGALINALLLTALVTTQREPTLSRERPAMKIGIVAERRRPTPNRPRSAARTVLPTSQRVSSAAASHTEDTSVSIAPAGSERSASPPAPSASVPAGPWQARPLPPILALRRPDCLNDFHSMTQAQQDQCGRRMVAVESGPDGSPSSMSASKQAAFAGELNRQRQFQEYRRNLAAPYPGLRCLVNAKHCDRDP